MARISAKNQITIPVAALSASGLSAGDEVHIEVIDDGELRLVRGARDLQGAFGVLTGLYPPNYLRDLDEHDEAR